MPKKSNLPDYAKRAERAWTRSANYRSALEDIHEYMLPFREPAEKSGTTIKVDRIFDGTGPKGAFRFAGRMQRDVTPAGEVFAELEPGPLVSDEDRRKRWSEIFEDVSKIAFGIIDVADFHTSSQEMYSDLFAGQGAMLMLESSDIDQVADFVPVPSAEVGLELGKNRKKVGTVWRYSLTGDEILETWPDAPYSEKLRKQLTDAPNTKRQVTQYTRRDVKTKRWHHRVWIKGHENDLLSEAEFRKDPWLTPRFFVVPGDPMGYGLAHLALPFVKTANKSRELALKAAAFALLGQWVHTDDGVFNPATAQFSPGSFWKVGKTGGNFGASIDRLPVPHDFDISSIVLQDEREQIKQVTLDEQLPPMTGSVRSPTEIVERMSQLDFDWGGVEGRLHKEIIKPMFERVIEIAENAGLLAHLLDEDITIDELLVSLSVLSPLSRSRRAREVRPVIDWVELLLAIGGKELVMLVARIEDMASDIGRKLGVTEDYIRSKPEKKQLMKMVAQMIAAQQAPPEAAAGGEGGQLEAVA